MDTYRYTVYFTDPDEEKRSWDRCCVDMASACAYASGIRANGYNRRVNEDSMLLYSPHQIKCVRVDRIPSEGTN